MGTGTFNNKCVCDIFSCSKNVGRGNVCQKEIYRNKRGGGGVRIAEEYAVSLIIKYRHSCLVAIIQTLSIECLRAMSLCKR